MAIDNDTSYELTGAQVKDLAQKIRNKADNNVFVGASSSVAGSKGLVPAPAAGDQDKVLTGAGTWASFLPVNVVSYSSSTRVSSLSTTWGNLYSFNVSAFPTGSHFIVIAEAELSTSALAQQLARLVHGSQAGRASQHANVTWGQSHAVMAEFIKEAGVDSVEIQGLVSNDPNSAWGCQAFAMRIS